MCPCEAPRFPFSLPFLFIISLCLSYRFWSFLIRRRWFIHNFFPLLHHNNLNSLSFVACTLQTNYNFVCSATQTRFHLRKNVPLVFPFPFPLPFSISPSSHPLPLLLPPSSPENTRTRPIPLPPPRWPGPSGPPRPILISLSYCCHLMAGTHNVVSDVRGVKGSPLTVIFALS